MKKPIKIPNSAKLITKDNYTLSMRINPIQETAIHYFYEPFLRFICSCGGIAYQKELEKYFFKREYTIDQLKGIVNDMVEWGLVRRQLINNFSVLSLTQACIKHFDINQIARFSITSMIKSVYRGILIDRFPEFENIQADVVLNPEKYFNLNIPEYFYVPHIDNFIGTVYEAYSLKDKPELKIRNRDGGHSIFKYEGAYDKNGNFSIVGEEGYYDKEGNFCDARGKVGYYDRNGKLKDGKNAEKHIFFDSFGFYHPFPASSPVKILAQKNLEICGFTNDKLAIAYLSTSSQIDLKQLKKLVFEYLYFVKEPYKLQLMLPSAEEGRVAISRLNNELKKSGAIYSTKFQGCYAYCTNAENYLK